jgi:aryl-alcohol dehydrogenase-like predicted oxidoreductase
MLDNWYQRGEYVRRAKDNGIEIHVRSVFLQGLFFMPATELPAKLNPLKSYLKQLQDLCTEQQMSMEMAAMAYALIRPEIDRVLLGVETPDQLSGILKQINQLELSDKFLESVDAIQVAETELLSPVNWK